MLSFSVNAQNVCKREKHCAIKKWNDNLEHGELQMFEMNT